MARHEAGWRRTGGDGAAWGRMARHGVGWRGVACRGAKLVATHWVGWCGMGWARRERAQVGAEGAVDQVAVVVGVAHGDGGQVGEAVDVDDPHLRAQK